MRVDNGADYHVASTDTPPQTPEAKQKRQSSDFHKQTAFLAHASARRGSACESLRTSQEGKQSLPSINSSTKGPNTGTGYYGQMMGKRKSTVIDIMCLKIHKEKTHKSNIHAKKQGEDDYHIHEHGCSHEQNKVVSPLKFLDDNI